MNEEQGQWTEGEVEKILESVNSKNRPDLPEDTDSDNNPRNARNITLEDMKQLDKPVLHDVLKGLEYGKMPRVSKLGNRVAVAPSDFWERHENPDIPEELLMQWYSYSDKQNWSEELKQQIERLTKDDPTMKMKVETYVKLVNADPILCKPIMEYDGQFFTKLEDTPMLEIGVYKAITELLVLLRNKIG